MKNPGVGSDQQWKKAECVWYLTGSSFNAVKLMVVVSTGITLLLLWTGVMCSGAKVMY